MLRKLEKKYIILQSKNHNVHENGPLPSNKHKNPLVLKKMVAPTKRVHMPYFKFILESNCYLRSRRENQDSKISLI